MAIIKGTDWDDIIDGTNYSDYIDGNGGDDDIYGYGGSDEINGGNGDDVIYGGAGNDDIIGGAGANDLWGGSGYDWFIMSNRGSRFSDDWIFDFEFDVDRIDLRAWGISDISQVRELLRTDAGGNAWFNAYYLGVDHFVTVDGVRANELLASDFIFQGGGPRNAAGSVYADTLFGSRSDDVLNGRAGADMVLGGLGDDLVLGAGARDELIGGAGHDILRGGVGGDILTGDAGADTFDFNSVRDSQVGFPRDRITDFQPGLDQIDLFNIDANEGLAGNQAFAWRADLGFTGAGQVTYTYVGGNTVVSANVDADLAAEFQVILTGRHVLTAGDFVL